MKLTKDELKIVLEILELKSTGMVECCSCGCGGDQYSEEEYNMVDEYLKEIKGGNQ